VKDGTFPTDLPAVKFKGFLQYPRSVPEDEKAAANVEEKEIIAEACRKVLQVRLRVFNNDLQRAVKGTFEPLISHAETLKEVNVIFPGVQNDAALRKHILDTIENELRENSNAVMSRARTPRPQKNKRNNGNPQPPPPPSSASNNNENLENVMERLHILEDYQGINTSNGGRQNTRNNNNAFQGRQNFHNNNNASQGRPNSPNFRLNNYNSPPNYLNGSGRGNGTVIHQQSREYQHDRQRSPFVSQNSSQLDYSKRQRPFYNNRSTTPTGPLYQQNQPLYPQNQPNYQNNFYHHNNNNDINNHHPSFNNNTPYQPHPNHPSQGRGWGGRGNPGRGSQNQFFQNSPGYFNRNQNNQN
jgi:hypothetical protein